MKKSISLLFAVAAAMPTSVFADDDGFMVHLYDGAAEAFSFSETKKIVFNDNGFTVEGTAASQLRSFNFDDVAKITFEDVQTAIGSVKSEDSADIDICLSSDRNTILLNGIDGSRRNIMRIYSVTGTTVVSSKNFSEPSVDISNLPEGIYILTINNNTFKFKK